MIWTDDDYQRASELLDSRILKEAANCAGRSGCMRAAVLVENGTPMCRWCSKDYLKRNPLYNRALNHAARVAVDVEGWKRGKKVEL